MSPMEHFFSPQILYTLQDIRDQHTPVWLISILLKLPPLKIIKNSNIITYVQHKKK